MWNVRPVADMRQYSTPIGRSADLGHDDTFHPNAVSSFSLVSHSVSRSCTERTTALQISSETATSFDGEKNFPLMLLAMAAASHSLCGRRHSVEFCRENMARNQRSSCN